MPPEYLPTVTRPATAKSLIAAEAWKIYVRRIIDERFPQSNPMLAQERENAERLLEVMTAERLQIIMNFLALQRYLFHNTEEFLEAIVLFLLNTDKTRIETFKLQLDSLAHRMPIAA